MRALGVCVKGWGLVGWLVGWLMCVIPINKNYNYY